MSEDLDIIKQYTIKLLYTCPVTKEEITLTNIPGEHEFEISASGGQWPNDTAISTGCCKSCGRYHDSFEL